MQEKSVDKTFYNNGQWHHGNGVLCVGSLRIAVESFDTNPDNEVKNEVFEYICETLNAKWKANIKIEALQKDKADLIEYARKILKTVSIYSIADADNALLIPPPKCMEQ